MPSALQLPDGAFAPRPRRDRPRRPWLRAVLPVLAVLAVVGLYAGTQQATPSPRPDAAQAAALADDPCGVLGRAELGPIIGELTGDFTPSIDGGIARCEHTGRAGARVLLVEIQLVAGEPAAALTAERARAEAAPRRLEGLGDEAWIVTRGVETVWARQGALLVGVAVVPREGDTDLDASRRVAATLLNLAASLPT